MLKDIVLFIIAAFLSIAWLCIVSVFIVGMDSLAKTYLSEDDRERVIVWLPTIVGIAMIVMAANLFMLRYTGTGLTAPN